MEKDNKYYSIIENIVKNHKKYNGYDAILDDIIDDVFKHSKTVMNSVKDEDVIISYLQKLVAVSIITVPKRLNFHNELKQKTLIKNEENNVSQFINTNTQNQTDEIKTDTPSLAQKEDTQKANTDFVDKMINSIDTASVLDNDSTVNKSDTENETLFNELLENDTVDAEQNLHEDISDVVLSGEERDILDLNLENTIVEESAKPETIDSFTENETVSLESDDLLAEEQPEEHATVDSFTENETVSFASDDLTTEEQPEEIATVDSFTEDDTVSFESVDLLTEEQPEEIATVDSFTEDDTVSFESVDLTTEEQPEEFATVDNFTEDETVSLESDDLLTEEQPEELATVDSFTEDETVSLESDDLLTEEQPEELATVDSFTEDETVSLESNDLLTEEQPEELATVDSFTEDETVSLESDDLLAEDSMDIQLQEDDTNLELNLLSDENNDNSSIDILSLDNDDNSQIQEFEDIQESDALDEDDSFEKDFNYDNDITIGLADDSSEAKDGSKPEYALVDYSPFSYIPDVKDIDADLQNIESKLIDLNRQKPELNILKIFDLRYKQNLPINKIAVDLNIQKQTVLQAIDEIVELI